MKKVAVFSPSRYSLYTICVTELLRRNGVEISFIAVRRLLNPTRFFSEYRRDGIRLLKKIVKKLILRDQAYQSTTFETIADFMDSQEISCRKVGEFKEYGIPVIFCDTLNDEKIVQKLVNERPQLVLFTGGGLIRPGVLENSGAGVVNCHAGILPRYRGMDVIEWALLEGRFDQVGISVHFMDRGVDTGDILRIIQIPIEAGDRLNTIRDKFEPIMCREIVSASIDYLDGKLDRKSQMLEDGKQFFVMHPRLVRLVEKRLNPHGDGHWNEESMQ
jgi:folate-dependent phosphoribosylglycinamide formyltransferase PurN